MKPVFTMDVFEDKPATVTNHDMGADDVVRDRLYRYEQKLEELKDELNVEINSLPFNFNGSDWDTFVNRLKGFVAIAVSAIGAVATYNTAKSRLNSSNTRHQELLQRQEEFKFKQRNRKV